MTTTTNQPAATCHVWCASHDTDLGFCHSEPTVIAGIDVHLAADTAHGGPTRLYLGTAYGQFELPVQAAAALFHAGLTQVHLALFDQIATECAAGAR